MLRTIGWFSVAFTFALAGSAAGRDRVLRRVPSAEKEANQAGQSFKKQVIEQNPDCKLALKRPRSLEGYRCLIQVLNAAAAATEIPEDQAAGTNRPLQRRLALAKAATDLGAAVETYQPVNPEENLGRQRFEILGESCVILGDLYDQLAGLSPTSPLASALQDPALFKGHERPQPLKDAVCGCSQRTLKLGQGAFLPASDPGLAKVSRALYGRGCFLDVEAGSATLVDLKRGNPGVRPESSGPVVAATDPSSQALNLAQQKAFQLNHCTDKLEGRRVAESSIAKLESCVCPTVKKWRFPNDTEAAVEVKIPLMKKAAYQLTITADGAVEKCSVLID